MQLVNLFIKKDSYHNLSINSLGEGNKMNTPMYNTSIQLIKGIENKVQFSIRDNDRKAVTFRDRTIIMALINKDKQILIEKELWCLDAYKGLFEVKFSEKELRDMEVGNYSASFYSVNLEGEKELLYKGVDWDIKFDVKIIEDVFHVYKPSVELDPSKFVRQYYTSKDDGIRYDYYTSSRVKADDSDNHTASISVKEYIGKVRMECSMENSPEFLEEDWITIDEHEFTVNDYTDEVKELTTGFQKTLNCKWIRFVYTFTSINHGNVTEILYRN